MGNRSDLLRQVSHAGVAQEQAAEDDARRAHDRHTLESREAGGGRRGRRAADTTEGTAAGGSGTGDAADAQAVAGSVRSAGECAVDRRTAPRPARTSGPDGQLD